MRTDFNSINKKKKINSLILFMVCIGFLFGRQTPATQASSSNAERYMNAVQAFADTVIKHGRDTYGDKHTPLFVDGLHADTLEPAIWKKDGESWVLCNVASQQPLFRLLDGLTVLTGEDSYRKAAKKATRFTFNHLQAPNGLLYWGGHTAWDLKQEKPVGQYDDLIHEVKGHQPYYRFMWQVDPESTRQLMEAIWGGHILDWSRLDYNRHASGTKPAEPKWDHSFNDSISVPFPAKGSNLSFANVTPPLMHSGVQLAVLDKNKDALHWTRRLAYRWQEGKHPETGLCGGQLSYREHDRAQDALGHVHPNINEAQIVASYHQTCRYHNNPLTQIQGGETLIQAGGDYAKVGKELIDWALDDLKIYAKQCYDPATGKFIAKMIDGTPLKWQEAKTGYYVPESFAPRGPNGSLFWGYALAYRLSKDKEHWHMIREIGKHKGLGDLGTAKGNGRALNLKTNTDEWQLIYALLEIHRAVDDSAILELAKRIADNLLKFQKENGLFPRPGRSYARTGDEVPLTLLHLTAALQGKSDKMPQPIYDSRFFHCEYHGELEEHQKKRADRRTYDHLVFYGSF